MGRSSLSLFVLALISFCGFGSANGLDTGIRIPLPQLPDCGGDICGAIEHGKKEAAKTVHKGFQELGNGASDFEKTIRTGNCGGDVCKTLEKAAHDTVNEGGRGLKNLEDAGHAIGRWVENEVHGVGDTFSAAEKRLRQGKVIDAMWGLSTDPLKHFEQNTAEAAKESNILRTVGQVAASAYGGPGGAAAYAAWLTYKETGNPDLALKVGLIAGATSAALGEVGKMPSDTAGQVAKQTILAGAIGGTAVAAAGGDKQAVWEGFLRSGGMILIQDGYQHVTTHQLDNEAMKSSKGEAYCMQTLDPQASCAPPAGAYLRDKDGSILKDRDGHYQVDVRKTDPYRPHVGTWSDVKPASWAQERSAIMTGVSRIPGMNAMSVFHDQWAVSWDMNTFTTVGTIIPAVVLTYTGTGAPAYDLILQSGVQSGMHQTTEIPRQLNSNGTLRDNDSAQKYSVRDIGMGSSSFICMKDQLIHRIVVEAPSNDPKFACKVFYVSENGISTPWSSLNDIKFCGAKAYVAVAEHVNEKWNCLGQ